MNEHESEPVGEDEEENFFYSSYMRFENAVVQAVRQEAFGEDIGQFGWTTADEYRHFFKILELTPESKVLDVACGSGGPALFTARTTGSHVTGVDITENGITTANEMAAVMDLTGRTNFQLADGSQPLPFDDGTFDAIMCMDAMNHFYDRVRLYREWNRLLRPGGRVLFTDPITVTGMLLRDEIIVRSGSMGLFVFTPQGTNEPFITAAGFEQLHVEDVTDNIVRVSGNWHAARARHEAELVEVEGEASYTSFQTFLSMVHRLSSERRLSRFLFVARKPN